VVETVAGTGAAPVADPPVADTPDVPRVIEEPQPKPWSGTMQRATIAAGDRHTCAVVRTGDEDVDRVKCWGGNDRGELGLGDEKDRVAANKQMGDKLPFVALDGSRRIVALGATSGRTCALQDSGTLWCWGADIFGSSGDEPALVPVAVDLPGPVASFALGDLHTCVALMDGTVRCAGVTPSPAVGAGAVDGRWTVVSLGQGVPAEAVVAGADHTCTLLDGGRVKCFGTGSYGALGLDHTRSIGGDPAQMGDALPFVDLGMSVRSLTAGGMHTCGLSADHRVKCWGGNRSGQLGVGHLDAPGGKPGQSRTAAPTGDDRPDVDLGGKVVAIAAGSAHTCALVERGPDDNGLKCWGTGPLGVFPAGTRGGGPGEMGDALPFVDLGKDLVPVAMALSGHTCVLVVDRAELVEGARPSTGRLKCWGASSTGASGIEEDMFDVERPETMGDNLPFVALGNDVRVVLP
jgi:alpha-tubulin suppressor-like RCC1 family protein